MITKASRSSEREAKVPGVVGVMYTTWQRRFDDLEAFASRLKDR